MLAHTNAEQAKLFGPNLRLGSRSARFVLALAIIAIAHSLFKIVFSPAPNPNVFTLFMTPAIFQSVERALSEDWTRLLLPYQYEPGRFYWASSIIPITYFAEKLLGPLGSFLLFSNLFVCVASLLGWVVTRSLVFCTTLAILFAFGTQLNYVYTYGNLTALYLLLTYLAINFTVAVLLVRGRLHGPGWLLTYGASLAVVAVANEMWINYATAMIAASTLGLALAWHHGQVPLLRRSALLLVLTLGVLAAYLAVRLQVARQYVPAGAEEELLLTYRHAALVVDDLVTNFFTLLYMTLSNYLPASLSASNSLTYLSPATIVAEQNGYASSHQNYVVMSHLFLWRFYAGIYATVFVAATVWSLVLAFRRPNKTATVVAVLALMTLAAFSTHLSIKMRPYNSVPALPYKVIVSVTAFSVLLAFLTWVSWERIRASWLRYSLVACVWACVLLAALTRPRMQASHLAEVGLLGLGDPLGQILQWFN